MALRAWKLEPSEMQANLFPVDIPLNVQTFDQLSQLLPPGAYTTLRTYDNHRVLHLNAHFERLESTAHMAGRTLILDRDKLRHALRRVMAGFPSHQEARLRLTLDLQNQPGSLYVAAETLQIPPPEAYRDGVRVITCALKRQLPKAKLTRFIARAESVRQDLPPSVNEALMVSDNGRLLEGLSSNFFAVNEGEIWTAEEGVLSGTTRLLVLEAIAELGLTLHLQGFPSSDLARLDEAFITSASRGILPVAQIDQYTIGSGRPGAILRQLTACFDTRLLAELEPI